MVTAIATLIVVVVTAVAAIIAVVTLVITVVTVITTGLLRRRAASRGVGDGADSGVDGDNLSGDVAARRAVDVGRAVSDSVGGGGE